MLLRISLIVAILASIGTLVVSHVQVSNKITNLETTLAATQSQLAQTQTDLSQAQSEAQEAKDLAEKTEKELEQTSQRLVDTTNRAQQQQQRADRAEIDLNTTRTELTASNRELSAWKGLGIPVDGIRTRLAELQDAREALAALQDENALLNRNLLSTKARLAIYEGDVSPPPPMPGLKGAIVAVDPKWEFVVLDVGGKQGALERGEMLVNRDGKLVAKIRITRVEDERSFANVLPEWKQAEVQVGDQALY
ncbi:MAG: hypothetical protein H7A45_16245 [Verrucomicrobiales bacterium]|nr:hypothetical protein [Verrucomicrobiales bacterium]MCP5527954.1 hypothetical protein [Verrucomicrobiales bacterium]